MLDRGVSTRSRLLYAACWGRYGNQAPQVGVRVADEPPFRGVAEQRLDDRRA